MDKVVEADINFHEVLYKASRNERLVEIIHNLREQTLRFRTMSMNQPGRLVKPGKSIACSLKPLPIAIRRKPVKLPASTWSIPNKPY